MIDWSTAQTEDPKRAGRARKAVENLVAQELSRETEFAQIDDMVDRVYASYATALRKAMAVAHDDPVLWRKVEVAQQAAINASNRQRQLASQLGEFA